MIVERVAFLNRANVVLGNTAMWQFLEIKIIFVD